MSDPPKSGLRSIIAGDDPARAGPRYFRDFARDAEGTPLVPADLAARIEAAVELPLRPGDALREIWEEAVAGVLVGLFTGMLHAPVHNATSPKHVGGGYGPAKRVAVAIAALIAAADALENLSFTQSNALPRPVLALLNREAAAWLAEAKTTMPRGRPTKSVQKRAVLELLGLYTLGFGQVPQRVSGSSSFRRFVEEVWTIALNDCGMDPKIIGTADTAWAAADHLLRKRLSTRQNDAD
jgi:hypothetical protein